MQRAFTLIEVLVSLAIFALASVVLAAAYVNVLEGYQSQDRARGVTQDMELARIAVLTQPDRRKLEAGGSMPGPDQENLAWAVEIKPAGIADLFVVKLEVNTTGDHDWRRSETMMLYRPGWMQPGEHDQLREQSRARLARMRAP